MDLFNKKKIKSLTWDVMALKARLESKESELERINKNLFRLYDDIAEAFLSKYEDKNISINNDIITVLGFSCQGGVPIILGEEFESKTPHEYHITWQEVLEGFKIAKTKKTKKK